MQEIQRGRGAGVGNGRGERRAACIIRSSDRFTLVSISFLHLRGEQINDLRESIMNVASRFITVLI